MRARHDRAAFATLYDLYVARVYAFCAIHSAGREEAEDLTAQTFARALDAIGRYEDLTAQTFARALDAIGRYEERGAPFSAWLLRIAANAAANRARRPVAVSLHAERAAGATRSRKDEAVVGETEEEWVEEWLRADWIEDHLAALPPDGRRVVQLRFYDDLSFDAVAAAMGRSEGAVKQLLRRTLTTLRGRIEEEGRRDGYA